LFTIQIYTTVGNVCYTQGSTSWRCLRYTVEDVYYTEGSTTVEDVYYTEGSITVEDVYYTQGYASSRVNEINSHTCI